MAVPVRFFVHVLPLSTEPNWLGWPLAAPEPLSESPATGLRLAPRTVSNWYAWRLMSMNNRELARSAFRFPTFELCREAVREVKAGAARLMVSTFSHPTTGEFSWCGELDGAQVAVGRRYEQEQAARTAALRFFDVVAGAEIASAVRALRGRRGPAPARYDGESTP